MLLSPRKNGVTSLFKEVRAFKASLTMVTPSVETLEAPFCVISQYYGCDTPYRAIPFREVSTPPKFLTQRARRGILMPRGRNCHETIFAAHFLPRNYPHHGGQFRKRKKCPLLWGRGNLEGILWDNLGEGNWSEGRGCLEEGRLGLPGVFPDIAWTAIFPRK